MDCVICRYGELALKGKNRGLFESRLVHNIKDCLKKNNIDATVEKVRGRIFVNTSDISSITSLKTVFGLVSLSPADISPSDERDIIEAAINHMRLITPTPSSTFRISTKRTDKEFGKTSGEMDVLIGSKINDAFGISVNLTDPDINLGVEIHDKTYIFHEKISCYGGLPIGTTGRVACLIRDWNDVLAAWLMMRRGCEIFIIKLKDIDCSMLEKYAHGTKIASANIDDIESAGEHIGSNRCRALVVGDLLDDFDAVQYSKIKYALLTPLIAHTETRINALEDNIK